MVKLVTVLAFVLALAVGGRAALADDTPVVLELYTSEGCSSCPPADQLLFELRERDDVLALAFHVDYWNYLGWNDRFASPAFTERQRRYAAAMGEAMVYTPQLVIDGRMHVVGSRREAIGAAIDRAQAHESKIEVGLEWTDEGALRISLPAADYRGSATIWFVRYADAETQRVTAGENAGRTLHHANVVEELAAIGMWKGEPVEITLPWEAIAAAGHGGGQGPWGCAILVQPEGLGPILGAREIDWSEAASGG